MFNKQMNHIGFFMGKVPHGADLLESLTEFCNEKGITLGRVEALGAVSHGRIGYYNQDTHKYEYHELDKAMEITNLVGNISVKDGKSIIHAHITFSDERGSAFGGHLGQGCKVFACEFVIQQFEGPQLQRGHDQITDLPLWNEDE